MTTVWGVQDNQHFHKPSWFSFPYPIYIVKSMLNSFFSVMDVSKKMKYLYFDSICLFSSLQPCMHTFCAACYSGWMERSSLCPTCRCPVERICKNHILNNLVEAYLIQHPGKLNSLWQNPVDFTHELHNWCLDTLVYRTPVCFITLLFSLTVNKCI